MEDGALSDLRIVEWGDFISAAYCTKLMADLGAEVIKVERPSGGDSARRAGPFPNDQPHLERSGLFAYLNTNKLGITLDASKPTGWDIFTRLVAQADILVENLPPLALRQLGLDLEGLRQSNPRLIVTSVTPFGQTGPHRDWQATDLVTFHTSGVGYATPCEAQDPEQERPLKLAGHQADFVAGLTAAVATMHALFTRKVTGRGQHVDVSAQEALAAVAVMSQATYFYGHSVVTRTSTPFGSPAAVPRGILPCRDGFIYTDRLADQDWRQWVDMMGQPEWAQNETLSNDDRRMERWPEMESLVRQWLAEHSKDEIYRAAQARRLALFPVNNAEDIVNSPHLGARGFFVEVDHPPLGRINMPGPPCQWSATPWRIRRPSPLLGQHNEAILCGRLGLAKSDLVKLFQAGIV